MQRMLSRRLVLKLSDDSCSLQACKTFTSLSKPVQTCHRKLLFSTSINHPVHPIGGSWESRHRFAERVYGFRSTPDIAKQFSMGSSNTLLRASRKSIAYFRVCLLRAKMSRQSFQFNPRFENYWHDWRSWFRRLTINDMVLGLIITNVAVFMLWRIADYSFMSKNFTIGRAFGSEFLLKLYVAGALGGSVFYLAYIAVLASYSKDGHFLGIDLSRIQGQGARGAVNAIMLLNIFLFAKPPLNLKFVIPVPVILIGSFFIGQDLSRLLEKNINIAGFVHLGGAVVAALAWTRLRRRPF